MRHFNVLIQRKHRKKKKTSFLKETIENADLHKAILNKTIHPQEQCVKYDFVAPLNVVLCVLPVTIHLKSLQTECYAWCYALCYTYYVLTFLLHAFAWPLHLPNIDVTTKLSKNSECKQNKKYVIVRPTKSPK